MNREPGSSQPWMKWLLLLGLASTVAFVVLCIRGTGNVASFAAALACAALLEGLKVFPHVENAQRIHMAEGLAVVIRILGTAALLVAICLAAKLGGEKLSIASLTLGFISGACFADGLIRMRTGGA